MTFDFILSVLLIFSIGNNPIEPVGEHPLLFEKYKDLLVNIRESYLYPYEAETEFKAIMQSLREKYPLDTTVVPTSIYFPLAGSNYRAVGGRNGNGFRPKGFNLFDNSVGGSHPAHDIFIYDRNYDSVDDNKNSYIDIVSVGYGVVIATETGWVPESSYKGGNYVWIYDTQRGGLWYYAHCRIVDVVPGQTVKPSDKIAEVGRTGYNAYKKRSDTHLHLMYLDLDEDFYPHPVNHYHWLKEAHNVYFPTKPSSYQAPVRLRKIKMENYFPKIQETSLSKPKSSKNLTEISLSIPHF